MIDGRNRLVLPGFVNTHVHLSEHVNRGVMADEIPVDRYMGDWLIPLYSAITPEEEAYSARLACLEMIRTGTTTFCEAGTLFDVARGRRRGGRDRHARDPRPVDVGSSPAHDGRMEQSTDEALRRNDEMIAGLNGRADGRIAAWPLLARLRHLLGEPDPRRARARREARHRAGA